MITLLIGGTRSGKSELAERLAGAGAGPVTYVATARLDPADRDHAERIAVHRRRRPAGWSTIECTEPSELPDVLRTTSGTVLVDSVGTWLTAHPDLCADLSASVSSLTDALTMRGDDSIVVSEEVGFAPHAPTEIGRCFVDQLGAANRRISEIADRAYLVVAGRAVELLAPGEPRC